MTVSDKRNELVQFHSESYDGFSVTHKICCLAVLFSSKVIQEIAGEAGQPHLAQLGYFARWSVQ